MRKETIRVSGMSCAACAARIEKSLGALSGVTTANVNFAMERATVEIDDKVTNLQKVEDTIKKIGYGVIKEDEGCESKVVLKISGMTCADCS